jgi:hypothetical protein
MPAGPSPSVTSREEVHAEAARIMRDAREMTSVLVREGPIRAVPDAGHEISHRTVNTRGRDGVEEKS